MLSKVAVRYYRRMFTLGSDICQSSFETTWQPESVEKSTVNHHSDVQLTSTSWSLILSFISEYSSPLASLFLFCFLYLLFICMLNILLLPLAIEQRQEFLCSRAAVSLSQPPHLDSTPVTFSMQEETMNGTRPFHERDLQAIVLLPLSPCKDCAA